MKSFFIACLAATSTLAAPLAVPQFGGFPSFGGGFGGGFGGSTKNDVTSGVCKPVTYIFARGTTELGNMGSTVGPALEKALESAFGANNVATQGVTYPADVAGAISGALNPGSAQGARTMASLTQQALSKCPDTKSSSPDTLKVPNRFTALSRTFRTDKLLNIDSGRTKIYCNLGDGVCAGAFIISAAHLSYATQDATPAAQFAKGVIGNI
ncbi:cutinase-domain-containing protein [Aureobasidium pullulans]|nr:cutinase-domain-containing protein [Aureobasidium pullulans]